MHYSILNEAIGRIFLKKCPDSEWRVLSQHDITEFLWPQLDGTDLKDIWFQQNDATLRPNQMSCRERNFLTVSSHAMATRIGH